MHAVATHLRTVTVCEVHMLVVSQMEYCAHRSDGLVHLSRSMLCGIGSRYLEVVPRLLRYHEEVALESVSRVQWNRPVRFCAVSESRKFVSVYGDLQHSRNSDLHTMISRYSTRNDGHTKSLHFNRRRFCERVQD